ncbi:ElyC/SanA/YdcF family protein [Sphingobium sp. B2]|uniref:ElyC/SanA/YdcF family protein n=1 Tax=Sphingobium sp. B2 TaxID=2583228 RepID=UPI0011A7D021|nr:ElyC/SanA/YdcF family protein [Sphingobium sp. B2]
MVDFLQNWLKSPLVWLGLGLLAALLIGGHTRRVAVLVAAVIWLLGTNPVADMVIRPLEAPYQTARPNRESNTPQWIVVLAAGSHWDTDLPPTAWLSKVSLSRVTEGVRLQRAMPRATLLLLGGLEPSDPRVHPPTYPTVAKMLGADPTRLSYLVGAANTEAEARSVGRTISRQGTLYLVTSASHLPRAIWLFRREGFRPIPAPAQQEAAEPPQPIRLDALIPQAENYRKVERAGHEYLGLLKVRLLG